jgi:iron complex transport system substrate-binding protein
MQNSCSINTTYFLLILILTASSCSTTENRKHVNIDFQSDIVTYAGRFSLVETDSCTILNIIDPWQGAGNVIHQYFLIKENPDYHPQIDQSRRINVPVKRIICMSTTHLAMIKALGQESSIAGVSGSGFVYDATISKRIKDGFINDIGYDSGINSELIIKSSPDLVMVYGVGSESAGYTAKIYELGTKVMYNADYLETDPLGKAEWIKVFGALFCKEKLADSLFSAIESKYNKLKEYISSNTGAKPAVMLGLPFRDTWYISPGNSYISRLIGDAGGKYLWENTESSVSMPYGLENVYIESLNADFWLNTGSVLSKEEIVSIDPRLGSVPPFVKGKLFNNNKRLNSSGGNDYWESGTINPHILLKDIASILHPELFPDHSLVYYRKIE